MIVLFLRAFSRAADISNILLVWLVLCRLPDQAIDGLRITEGKPNG